MTLGKLFGAWGAWGVMVVGSIIVNLALLAAAVWLVVKVLQWTGVL